MRDRRAGKPKQPSRRTWLRRWLGERGERAAARFLRRRGYRILARSWRTPMGELDLIAQDGCCIVFVEVKTRSSASAGRPEEAVTEAKKRKLTALALAFLKRRGWLDRSSRFDVISIFWPQETRRPVIEHYVNAFAPTGRGQMHA